MDRDADARLTHEINAVLSQCLGQPLKQVVYDVAAYSTDEDPIIRPRPDFEAEDDFHDIMHALRLDFVGIRVEIGWRQTHDPDGEVEMDLDLSRCSWEDQRTPLDMSATKHWRRLIGQPLHDFDVGTSTVLCHYADRPTYLALRFTPGNQIWICIANPPDPEPLREVAWGDIVVVASAPLAEKLGFRC